jgi:hypothetical protein
LGVPESPKILYAPTVGKNPTAIPRGFQLEHKKKWLEWFFNSATQQR